MGVTGVRRGIHVLVVAARGGALVRLSVERALRTLGWVPASSPADADLLAVCGTPADQERDAIEQIWRQLPGPRARVEVTSTEALGELLSQAASALEDHELQATLAQEADASAPMGMDHEDMDHAGMDHAGMDHGDMDHGDMDHGDMDHGDMSMTGPGGIALAGSSDDDRDGLEMDVGHVILGAGLPGWPAGLVLRATLHGDVVTGVEVLASPAPPSLSDPAVRAALLVDAAAGVLDLAGWSAAADSARRARDDLMDAAGATRIAAADVARLTRRVRRSVLLRWSLEGPGHRAPSSPAPGSVVRRRLIALLEAAATTLADPQGPAHVPLGDDLALLPELAEGQELASLRLLVASMALDAGVAADA
ncbi:hypothetical protein Q6346_05215 [Isoptericola sp. b490]|uniref:hypothetical protein n=1 Tax=Actinotalea lenta TaxID=3064654 RepID=UPI0027140664|nr:hypothetical protein [Isoptericola sp. b490]MDO8120712.1 hypothetical protein [Isoptericola sp. b490]